MVSQLPCYWAEFTPRVLLKGFDRLLELLIKGPNLLPIRLPQVLLDDRRGVGFNGLRQAGQTCLFGLVGRQIRLVGVELS